MFTNEEKEYYQELKASDNLRMRVLNIEDQKKPFFNYRLLTLATCLCLFIFSFSLFNHNLELSYEGIKLNDNAQVIKNNVTRYRLNTNEITINTNHDVTILESDGKANYIDKHIIWLIEEANDDMSYTLNLSYNNKDYQILLIYDKVVNAYTMSVSKLEGEKQ